MPVDEHGRSEPPQQGDERATLLGFLQLQRETTEWKCSGLSEDQLRSRPFSTTNLSLLGLVRHLAEVERGWTRGGMLGQRPHSIWCTEDKPDADFDDVDTADVEDAFAQWRQEREHTDQVLSGKDLAETFANRRGTVFSIRWLIAHLIEEYARHNGHADLIRQAIDGATGE